jgi:hypothetical protein
VALIEAPCRRAAEAVGRRVVGAAGQARALGIAVEAPGRALQRDAAPHGALLGRAEGRASAAPRRKLRPQPLHTASPWLVEQMAMHGASGVVAYQASQASRAAAASWPRPSRLAVVDHQRVDLGQRRTSAQALMPSGDGGVRATS